MKSEYPGILIIFLFFISWLPALADESGYQVIETVAHDPSFFTQGFELHNGVMYESSGLYGRSKVRKYLLESDKTLADLQLPESFFAEGLTLLKDTLYVITWKENTVLLLDPADLKRRGEINYEGEGWGLANNGQQLIMSDGSDTISFRDPVTFEIERQIKVTWGPRSISQINELEFALGYIWANVWRSPAILKINPSTGNVAAVYDLRDLAKDHTNGRDNRVLNGIAYDKQKKAFWVTGKFWSSRYLIEF